MRTFESSTSAVLALDMAIERRAIKERAALLTPFFVAYMG